jgi:hypothetical protein
VNDRPVLAEATTPDGVRVVLFEDTWRDHILDPEAGHAELAPYLLRSSLRSPRRTIANRMNAPVASASSSRT